MSVIKMSSKVVVTRKASDLHANRLLGLLPPRDYQRLRPHLQRVPLEYRLSLYRGNKRIEFVYFIETGVGSLVNTMRNGQAAEVGTIGNEGLVGLPILFGDDKAPTSVYVQVPGAGLRMKATLFKKELAQNALMPSAIRPTSSSSTRRRPSRRWPRSPSRWPRSRWGGRRWSGMCRN